MKSISEIQFMPNNTIKYYNIAKDNYDRDIIPGVYEGGFKLWECTIDMLNYIVRENVDFDGKNVLDLGCGHGLLGMAALKKGAISCTFQDYNQDVLQNITIPNLQLNQIPQKSCKFSSGDWTQIADNYTGQKFDIILGSEVIYREQNYQKIVNFCNKMLKDQGKAILANKHYYFGVGGNMNDFKQFIEEAKMGWESLERIVPSKGGNKKQIISLFKLQS